MPVAAVGIFRDGEGLPPLMDSKRPRGRAGITSSQDTAVTTDTRDQYSLTPLRHSDFGGEVERVPSAW